MFEHKDKPLLPKIFFYKRMARSIAFAIILLVFSLWIGMWGYHHFEHMNWIDAYANATMILGGMGPLDPIHSWEGKLFAGSYALYSGIAFLVIIAVVLAPVLHRFFHKFHLDASENKK